MEKTKSTSLLIDESTDIASDKHLCICIRYFSEKVNSVMTAFAGLVPIVEAMAEALFNAVKAHIEKLGLSLLDCIGLGCDSASDMVGRI